MSNSQSDLRFGLFTFDPGTRTLSKDGRVIPIQDHPAKILALLLESPGEVVTRDRIRLELWPSEEYGEFTAGVNTAVSKLRSALNDSASRPVYIETVPKIGYRFAAPVQTSNAAPLPVAQVTPRRSRVRATAVVFVGALLLAALAVFGFRSVAVRRGVEDLQVSARPLTTFGGSVNRPQFSPDGKFVSFDWDGPKRDNLDIYLLRIGEDNPVRLTTDPADENWGVFSPDGSHIAFLRHSEENSVSVIMMALPGKDERMFAKISRAPAERPRLDWSGDGKYLLTNQRDRLGQPSHLVLIDAATGQMRKVTSPAPNTLGDSEASFSPDGRQIAFRRTLSSAVEDVYVMSVGGGEPRRVTFDNRGVSAIAWAENGSALLVSSRRRGSTREIWRFALSGGDPQRLTTPALDAGGQAVSRDGSHVVFVQSMVDTNVYEYDLPSGANPRRVADSALIDGGPVLSPDGTQFAFRSTRSGAEEFWIAARDGSNPRRLTSFGGSPVGWIRWSPDGKRLAFDARIDSHSDCFLINADGSNLVRLKKEPTNESSPNFSTDGRYLYFASNQTGSAEIWRQPLAGGPAVQLTTGGGNQAVESPDGKMLYYARRVPSEIRALPLDGQFPSDGRLVVAFENGAYGKWSVTAEGIYFTQTDPKFSEPLRIRMLPFGTTAARDIGPMPRQARSVDGGISVSSDGKSILLGLVDRSGSGLVLANLK